MALGKERSEWNRTASQLAMLFNANRDPKRTSAMSPSDFHPLERKARGPRGVPLRGGIVRMVARGIAKRKKKRG